MSKHLILLLGLSLSIISFTGCSKGGDEPVATVDSAGKGGNAILHVTPRHHGRQIDSCTIYVKYNALDTPANNRYDDSAKCVQIGGVPVATFSGLRKGNYYLFGLGWDPNLIPPQSVRGGYAARITSETDQSIDLAVFEEH